LHIETTSKLGGLPCYCPWQRCEHSEMAMTGGMSDYVHVRRGKTRTCTPAFVAQEALSKFEIGDRTRGNP